MWLVIFLVTLSLLNIWSIRLYVAILLPRSIIATIYYTRLHIELKSFFVQCAKRKCIHFSGVSFIGIRLALSIYQDALRRLRSLNDLLPVHFLKNALHIAFNDFDVTHMI